MNLSFYLIGAAFGPLLTGFMSDYLESLAQNNTNILFFAKIYNGLMYWPYPVKA